jgi:hypothetical protein
MRMARVTAALAEAEREPSGPRPIDPAVERWVRWHLGPADGPEPPRPELGPPDPDILRLVHQVLNHPAPAYVQPGGLLDPLELPAGIVF